jgi:hypothetical protein
MSPKAIGMGAGSWGVHCTRCHRISRHFLCSGGDHEEGYRAVEAARYDFVRSLNLETIDQRMHEIARKFNYLIIYGKCECGGPYSLEAKARCPYCNEVAVDSYFHHVQQPPTPDVMRKYEYDWKPLYPPDDWNDAAGWTRYFARRGDGCNERDLALCGVSLKHFPRMFRDWWDQGWWKVWFPGCGINPLPRLLASFGFVVHATDIAPTALAYQNFADHRASRRYRWLADGDETFPKYTGELRAQVHDMRTPYKNGYFDVVVNINAFSGFPPEDMRRIAGVHQAALKPGGRAIFDVVTTDTSVQNAVEQCLAEAGFHVPNLKLSRRARGQLAATGIPHVVLLGRPIIPRLGIYLDDDLRRRDTLVLREIVSRYLPYADKYPMPLNNFDAKTAVLSYSHLSL